MAPPIQPRAFALEAGERSLSIKGFAAYLVLAGLANAAIVALIFCHLPASRVPTLHSLLIRAVIYVACAAAAGAAGAQFYWNRSAFPRRADPPLSFLPFAIANAMAWVWVPAIVFLSRQDSPAFAAFCALGAALLASGLRGVIPVSASPPLSEQQALASESGELFAATLRVHPREGYGAAVALCLYLAGYCFFNRSYLTAGLPLALAAFVFAWGRTFVPLTESPRSDGTRGARRLATNAIAAVLVTLFALLFGVGHRNSVEAARAALLKLHRDEGVAGHDRRRTAAMQSGISGYESIILWPVPEKKPIVAPVPADVALAAERAARPIVIRFNGPYWYFQPPGRAPSPTAHQARGTPLTVNVAANNFAPLNMEAIQSLDSPIPLSRCGELQVEIENHDNTRGEIQIGVVLIDSSAPGKPSLSLGSQPVPSSEFERFSVKVAPVDEVLRFPIPVNAPIHKFDQMMVVYSPGWEHWQLGAKIAVEQFEILPR
jgi:hypothetical protein